MYNPSKNESPQAELNRTSHANSSVFPTQSRKVSTSRGILLCVLFGFFTLPLLATEPQEDLDEALPLVVEKSTGIVCDSGVGQCSGDYSDLVMFVRVNGNGKSYVRLTQPFIDSVNTGICTLTSSKFITLNPDGDGGEENQLNVLYMSWMTDAFLVIRYADSGDGSCEIKQLYAMYP